MSENRSAESAKERVTSQDIDGEVAAMRQMTVAQLRVRYEDIFGQQPRSGHKEHLVRRIAWRMQAVAQGGLSKERPNWPTRRACVSPYRETAAQTQARLRTPAQPPRETSEFPCRVLSWQGPIADTPLKSRCSKKALSTTAAAIDR